MLVFAWILWWFLTIALGIVVLLCVFAAICAVVVYFCDRDTTPFARVGALVVAAIIALSFDIAVYIFLCQLIFGGYLS